MPALLLQKPSFKSTSKQHFLSLSRRFQLWEVGDFKHPKGMNEKKLARMLIAKLVLEGKIKAAMKLLDQQNSRGVLLLSQNTIDELMEKRPDARKTDPTLLVDGNPPFVDHVMFEDITEFIISEAALKTKGSNGPSGLDADGWRRILVLKNFGSPGQNFKRGFGEICKKNVHSRGRSTDYE